jgi:subtilisin family serine protease
VFTLLRPAVVVAAALLLLLLPGNTRSGAGAPTADATAHLAGSVRKPITPKKAAKPSRPKAKPRRPVAVDPTLPNDPLWRDSWSLTKVGAPAAWRVTKGAAEVVVAVLDTGIDRNHPDLQGSFVEGWDAVNEDADANDDHGHGTLVAGVIAARSNNGIGGVGACSQCSLMPIKVIGGNGSGNAVDIAEGIVWAADHGARVINMSFVLSGSDAGVAAALEHARSKGVLIVAAAGNNGSADVTFPAGQPGVVSVTGTDASDGRYEWASYGNWVTLAAPGCSQSTQAGGGYADFCGTSSAAAFASGIAALARSAAREAPVEQIVAAMSTNAVRVGDFVATGRVDAAATATALSVSCCGPAGPVGSHPGHPEPHPDRL